MLSIPRAVQQLRFAAEATKIALSSNTSHPVHISDLLPGASLDLTVTREQFQEMCRDLFQICIDSAELVLRCGKSYIRRPNPVLRFAA